jgi:hypothetical protein
MESSQSKIEPSQKELDRTEETDPSDDNDGDVT